MDGIKKARIERCRRCPHRVDKHEKHAGPHGYSRFCTGGDGPPIELHDDYMEGPDSNCPKDYWSGLDPRGPKDPAEWRRWDRERRRKQKRQEQKPRVKQTVRQVEQSADIDADAETALAVLVAAGRLPGWLADEIAGEVGTTTT